MAKTKHIHLYKRVDLARKKDTKSYPVLKCMKPLCNHYIPLNLAIGKMAECNRCNDPFILDKETILLSKPHCKECIVRKPKPEVESIEDFLRDKGI